MRRTILLAFALLVCGAVAQVRESHHESMRKLQSLAREQLRRGELDVALANAEAALDWCTKHTLRDYEVQATLGDIYLALNRPQDAVAAFGEHYRPGRDLRLMMSMAVAASRAGNEDLALTAYGSGLTTQSLMLKRNGVDADELLLARDSKAIQSYGLVLRAIDPHHAPEDAILDLEAVDKQLPNNSVVLMVMGDVLIRLKKVERAREVLEKAKANAKGSNLERVQELLKQLNDPPG